MTIRRTTFTALTGAVLALTLAACGSSSGSGGTSAATPSQSPAGANGQGGGRGGPAADGTIAAVASSSLEVQSPSAGQVTVNFSGSTTFTNRASASLADVTTGSCVLVTGTGQPITAQTVDVTAASSTGCQLGGGGMRPQNGGGGTRPSWPAGAPRRGQGAPGGGGRAAGKVTAVSATGFTVQQDNPQTGATTDVQVTVNGSTTYTKAESANASALKVGECVTANGQADSTGAVTATTIAISQAGPNGCTVAGGRQRAGANGGANG
jgi:hypothetical protein